MIRRIASYLLVVVIMVSVILVLSENRGAKEKGVRLSTEQDAQITGITDETLRGQVVQAAQRSFEANRHYFTQNKGRLESDGIQYYYNASGRGIAFMESAVLLRLQEPGSTRGHIIGLEFEGANGVDPEGGSELPHKSNYFIGGRSDWRRELANYEEVWYRDLYPGIDARFCFSPDGDLKSEYILYPGAEPRNLRLRYEGATNIATQIGGGLSVQAGRAHIKEDRPRIYQDDREIKGRFVITSDGYVTFEIGEYDPSRVLVIDPSYSYSTYLGGSSTDRGESIAIDGDGNAYITGWTYSTDFPTTAGAFDTSFNGGQVDVFVSKLNSTGSSIVYSTYLGGNGEDIQYEYGCGIAVDSNHKAYITGHTESTNFPTVNGSYDTSHGGHTDVFVCKLDSSGSDLEYSTFLGGSAYDYAEGIAVDGSGNAYVTGITGGDFPTTGGAYDTGYNGNNDVFVAKLNSTGSSLSYSTYLGGSDADWGYGIALDGSNNAYVTGYTESTNFPTAASGHNQPYDGTHNGDSDVFVSKLNSSGSTLVYSTYIGGGSQDRGRTIYVDDGDAYVAGFVQKVAKTTLYPTTQGAYDTSFNGLSGDSDGFVSQLNSHGSALVYSTFLGGSGIDIAEGIVIDSSGDAFVTGMTESSDFPTTSGSLGESNSGYFDAFLSELSSDGTSLEYSTYLGGSEIDEGRGIGIDSSSDIYVVGVASSTNFPTTSGSYDTSHNDGSDCFVTKFDFSSMALRSQGADNEISYSGEDPIGATLPTKLELDGPFPLPVQDDAKLRLSVPQGLMGRVVLRLFDLNGREVIQPILPDASLAGEQTITWSPRDVGLPPGVYWWNLRAGDQEVSKPMVVIR